MGTDGRQKESVSSPKAFGVSKMPYLSLDEAWSRMSKIILKRLKARETRLSNFRCYDLLVPVFGIILLISNLAGQKICAIPLFYFHRPR